ncbi:hypothetical protein [Acinetobacter dispersus]|uniref:hypothetical protein n=1 Tax=Acinetobacter dispersus TaxID=70348 RepID=UPI001F4ADBE6|nr:hypothetical protein [Acinetobacter dispersus]MCH7391841.1 hypothetical protein [Acinetobacter dispersus]
MSAIQFIKDHGIEKAREVVEGAPETATHFTEALGGHYAKEGMLKMKPQWLWFNSINKEWYYDFAAKDHIHLPDLKRVVEDIDLLVEHSLSGCWGIDDIYGIEGTGMYLDGYAFYSNAEEKAELDRLQLALDRTVKAFGGEHV